MLKKRMDIFVENFLQIHDQGGNPMPIPQSGIDFPRQQHEFAHCTGAGHRNNVDF
jgi:hypothetical protein